VIEDFSDTLRLRILEFPPIYDSVVRMIFGAIRFPFFTSLFFLAVAGSGFADNTNSELIEQIKALREQNDQLLQVRSAQARELEEVKQQLAEDLTAKNRQLQAEFEAQQAEIAQLKKELAMVRQPTEQQVEELTEKAKKVWSADIALGASLSRGNNDSHRVNAEFKAQRKQDDDQLDFGMRAEIGENEGETTSEYIEADAQYRRNISDKFYWYGLAQGRRDAVADLDYRISLGPGVGYRLIESEDFSLLFEGGPAYVAEKFASDSLDHSLRGRLYEEFVWNITPSAKFYQTAEYLNNLQDLEDWIIELEAGIETAITETLSLRFSAINRYDNVPASGAEKNDLSLNSAIVYRFQ